MALSGSAGTGSRFIDADGLRLKVLEVSDALSDPADAPSVPVIVFVHGFPDTSAVWLPVMERLRADFRCVAYDVRGAGESDVPPSREGYRIPHLVSDLVAVVDAVSPDRPVHLVGHDWGSVQSWESVLRASGSGTGADPRLTGRIASYTTISGPSIGHLGLWLRSAVHGTADRRRKVATQALHSWYVLGFQLPWLPDLGLRRLLATPEKARRFLGSGHAAATVARDAVHGLDLYRANLIGAKDGEVTLRTDLPVQLIVPLRDTFLTAAVYDDLPSFCTQLTRHDIDAGHWAQQSHPGEVARLVAEFVRRVETQR